jgi:hypothetical protein
MQVIILRVDVSVKYINPLTTGTCNAGPAKPTGQKRLSDLSGKRSQDPEVKGLM